MSNSYEELKDLIETTERRTELECRKYLFYVKEILMNETPVEYVYAEKEYQGYAGPSDYILSGRVPDSGTERVHACVWELKAPQCPIFKKDNEHRLKPSDYLVDAENKLLHTFDELRSSEVSRQHFSVSRSNHVHLGGIIIGSERTKVTGSFSEPALVDRLYQRAIDARMCMYRPAGIRLLTWDQVLDQLKPPYQEGETIVSGLVTTVTTMTTTTSEVTYTTLPPEQHSEEETQV